MKNTASPFAKLIKATPMLSQIPSVQVRVIIAMRVAVMAHAQNQDVHSYLKQQIGGELAAKRFAHVMEAMGDCWPKPISVHRPCCANTSYDEMLMIDLITAVVQEDQQYFDGLLSEMLSSSERRKVHERISAFTSTFQRQNHL